jgi:glucose-1-phosphate adenylyltransferase
MAPAFLGKANWPIRTVEEENPPAMFGESASVSNSLISDGCVIEGRVEHSVLSPGVRVAKGAIVRDSIILNDAVIGRDSVIDYSIIDKEVVVEAECYVGYGDDYQISRREPRYVNTGITIIGKRARVASAIRIGRNCLVHCNVVKGSFLDSEVPSGETVRPAKMPSRR